MFKPSKMLLKYMSEEPRDIYDIIGALIGYINSDPEFKTHDFDNAVQFVLDNGVSKKELFSDFDPEVEYEQDSSKWDEEYYSFARVYLKDNFSEKRLGHVKAVAHKLYPQEVKISEEQKSVEKPKEGINTTGKEYVGKKSQGQQQINSINSTTQTPRNAKIVLSLIGIVVIVLLALKIVSIIK